MKKEERLLIYIGLIIVVLLCCTSCGSMQENQSDIFVIDEQYQESISELQLNYEVYHNKTVSIVGYLHEYIDETGKTYYSVIRYYPDNHNHDHNGIEEHHESMIPIGLELDITQPQYEIGSWIQAKGNITRYMENDIYYLRLSNVKITPLDSYDSIYANENPYKH